MFPSTIPAELDAELLARANAKESLRDIAQWLVTEKGLPASVSHSSVARRLSRLRAFEGAPSLDVLETRVWQDLAANIDHLAEAEDRLYDIASLAYEGDAEKGVAPNLELAFRAVVRGAELALAKHRFLEKRLSGVPRIPAAQVAQRAAVESAARTITSGEADRHQEVMTDVFAAARGLPPDPPPPTPPPPPPTAAPSPEDLDLAEAIRIIERSAAREPLQANHPAVTLGVTVGAPAGTLDGRMPGRNEPCPCGSGRKYKKCHGNGTRVAGDRDMPETS